MTKLGAAIFPLLAIVLFITTVVCVYIIAVVTGHVDPIWPYISDCAALYPESSIFAQLLDVTSCLVVWTAYLRNRRIRKVIDDAVTASDAGAPAAAAAVWRRRIKVASFVAFVCALIAVFSLVMVGNFQEFRRGDIHYVATLMLAFGGGLYMVIDTLITYVLCRRNSYSTRTVVVLRAVLVLFTWIAAILSIGGREESVKQWNAHFPNQTNRERFRAQLHWNKKDPAYALHVISTVSEWVIGLMFIGYFGSFAKEFVEFSASVQIIVHPSVTSSIQPDDTTSSDAAASGAHHAGAPGTHSEAASAAAEEEDERTPVMS